MTTAFDASGAPVDRGGDARAEGSAGDEAATWADRTGRARTCSEVEVS